jgi:DNA repair protein RecN (Recombination protein N)
VDAGVGGRAAVEVGRRLARLAAAHQVLVVTHLPQVAAYADGHLVVDKAGSRGVTRSDVRLLDETGRTRELARMLAGDMVDGRTAAEQLLAAAAADKAGRADPAGRAGAAGPETVPLLRPG